jgi:Sec-independent protein secretion pathway component TatC
MPKIFLFPAVYTHNNQKINIQSVQASFVFFDGMSFGYNDENIRHVYMLCWQG